jgi:hypothetical protein
VQLRPEDIKKAQQWIGASNPTNATELPPANNSANSKKSVSFSNTNMMNVVEEHEMEQFEPNEPINNFNENNFEETDFIFSKFKKISEPLTDMGLSEPNASITIQQLYNKLLELERNMNAKHAEIMEHLHGLNIK